MTNNKMSIKKEFVPYEESLVLKELGFNEECFAYYNNLGIAYNRIKNTDTLIEAEHIKGNWCTAPLYQQAFRWFREKYGLYYFEDHRCNSKTDISSITYWMGIKKLKLAPFGSEVLVGIIELGCYNTYEEVELACLRKLIEIAKTK